MPAPANPLSAKTLRWSFEDGPMAGATFEHHFYADGTVSYRSVDDSDDAERADKSQAKDDRPKYRAFDIGEDLVLASYLGDSGYALTVALNFADGHLVGFA